MTWQERLFVGWVGPRGIVAASVAGIIELRLLHQSHEFSDTELILPIVFLVIILTVIFHGLSLAKVANLLGLNVKCGKGLIIVGASPWATDLALELKDISVNTLIVDSTWYKLKQSRQLGLETHFGEAVIELENSNIDLTEYSYLLAATDSNSYNTLVCNNFAEDLGQTNVYQLPLGGDELVEELPSSTSGQVVDTELNRVYKGNIKELFNQGWGFTKSNITGEYSYEDFDLDNPPALTINLLKVNKDKDIEFITDSEKVNAKAGDVIVSFIKAH